MKHWDESSEGREALIPNLLLGSWVRRVTQVGLDLLVPWEDLISFFLGDGWHDDDVLSRFPIHRRGNAMFCRHLQGHKDTFDFVKVATGRGRVGERKFEFFIRTNDENTADRKGVVGVGVDHAIQIGDLPVVVTEDGVLDFHRLGLFNILHPTMVILHRVHRERNDLRIHRCKVRGKSGNCAQLCGAHRLYTPITSIYYVSKSSNLYFTRRFMPQQTSPRPKKASYRVVLGVRKENAPAVSKPLVELNRSLGRVLFKVRHNVSKFNFRHGVFSC